MADDICYPNQDWLRYRGNEKRHMAGEVEQTHYVGCWRDPAHHGCAVALLLGIRDVIPMGFLRQADAPGATGPTSQLDLIKAVRLAVETGRRVAASHATTRAEALEEAAKACDIAGRGNAAEIIRALKDRRP